jgi:hypothetical protein
MDLIPILKTLSRHRRLVIVAGLLALAIGVEMGYSISLSPPGLKTRQYQVGVASTNVLVDTSDSTVADLNPPGGDSLVGGDLSARATLLASLMATPPLQQMIARNAQVPVDKLTVVPPAGAAILVPTPLATAAATADPATSYSLTLNTGTPVPIISIAAQAPDAAQASRLAAGAVTALKQYLATLVASQKISPTKRPVITALGGPQAREATKGPRKLYSIVAILVTFVVFCALIVLGDGFVRAWRKSDEVSQPTDVFWPQPSSSEDFGPPRDPEVDPLAQAFWPPPDSSDALALTARMGANEPAGQRGPDDRTDGVSGGRRDASTLMFPDDGAGSPA